MDKHFDAIIVGQGVAGTVLAMEMIRRGKKPLVIDDAEPETSSRMAAGLINPITGRRYHLSWQFEILEKYFRETYKYISKLLGREYLLDQQIFRSIKGNRSIENWLIKSEESEYAMYVSPGLLDTVPDDIFEPGKSWIHINRAYRLRLGEMMKDCRTYLEEHGLFQEAKFIHAAMQIGHENVKYGEFDARGIVFAEGADVLENPLFSHLPFNFNKGDILEIDLKDATPKFIYKDKMFLIPIGDDKYWAGSTYDREYTSADPDPDGGKKISSALNESLTGSWETIRHRASVRPTTRDRRPFLGSHPDYHNVYLFNGLGTKGCSIAPWSASVFCDFYFKGKRLDRSVDLKRYLLAIH